MAFPAEKTSFLKDWLWANFFYFLPASLLVPLGAFLQPPDGGMQFEEVWLSLVFYSNLAFLLLIFMRYLGLKRRGEAQNAALVPLDFFSGLILYLAPFAFLLTSILVGIEGTPLLKLAKMPDFLAGAPFLTLCFFFAFPLLWFFSAGVSWLVCFLWRTGRFLHHRFKIERLKNASKSVFKEPPLAGWIAVNIFYLMPASFALPFLIFTHSEDPDAFFILIMAWLILGVTGNFLAASLSFLRYLRLRKQGVPDFHKIILSPVQSNFLYILPLVFVGTLEGSLTSWGKTLFQMDFDLILRELPFYVGFFLLDFIGFWLLASFFSWLIRGLATIFWQPDPKASPLKGKKKPVRQEMPPFLIYLPASLTGNLLEDQPAAKPAQTHIAQTNAAQMNTAPLEAPLPPNRPKVGIRALFTAIAGLPFAQYGRNFCGIAVFYLLPLAVSWGAGAVFILKAGNWQDLGQLALWASLIAFLLGLCLQPYLFLLGKLKTGSVYLLRGKTASKKSGFLADALRHVFVYLLPAPLLVGFLATLPNILVENPIAPRSALMGAGAVLGMALVFSFAFQLFCAVVRNVFLYFFGEKYRKFQKKWQQFRLDKKTSKRQYSKWQRGKIPAAAQNEFSKTAPAKAQTGKKKISKIVTYDGRIISLKPPKKKPDATSS